MSDDNVYEIHRYGRVKPFNPPQLVHAPNYHIQAAKAAADMQKHFAMVELQDNMVRLNDLHSRLKQMLVELESLVKS